MLSLVTKKMLLMKFNTFASILKQEVDVNLSLLVTMLLQQFDVFAPISEQEVEEHFNGEKS